MTDRFSIRPDATGFSVYDLWTGETVIIAMTPQDGLSREDADHTAALMNRRARQGERAIPQ
jgi:hypothetical protein